MLVELLHVPRTVVLRKSGSSQKTHNVVDVVKLVEVEVVVVEVDVVVVLACVTTKVAV
jgi:hypothetical protein